VELNFSDARVFFSAVKIVSLAGSIRLSLYFQNTPNHLTKGYLPHLGNYSYLYLFIICLINFYEENNPSISYTSLPSKLWGGEGE
jgi:hypothetical protein